MWNSFQSHSRVWFPLGIFRMTWLVALNWQEGFAFAHCTTCKAPYHLRVHVAADRKWRTLKFRFFVTRDILFIFLAVQLVGHFYPFSDTLFSSSKHFGVEVLCRCSNDPPRAVNISQIGNAFKSGWSCYGLIYAKYNNADHFPPKKYLNIVDIFTPFTGYCCACISSASHRWLRAVLASTCMEIRKSTQFLLHLW